MGVSSDFPVFSVSLLSQERVKLKTSNWPLHSQYPSEQKPIKTFGTKGAWAYPGTSQFWSTPYYLRNFKFCTHILSINRNKSPLHVLGKVAMGLVRDSKFFSIPMYWAHRAVIFAIAQLFWSISYSSPFDTHSVLCCSSCCCWNLFFWSPSAHEHNERQQDVYQYLISL